MSATRPTTVQQRQQIMELVQSGHSCAAITQLLKLSYWTVRKKTDICGSIDVPVLARQLHFLFLTCDPLP